MEVITVWTGRGRRRGLADRSEEQNRLSGVERECFQKGETSVRKRKPEGIVLDSVKGGRRLGS